MKAKQTNQNSINIFLRLKEDLETQNRLLAGRVEFNKRLIKDYEKEIKQLSKTLEEE